MTQNDRPHVYTEVFLALIHELEYLHEREKAHHVIVEDHSVSEWIILIEEYLARAKKALCGFNGKAEALDNMRKIGAMAAACMFHQGVSHREVQTK